MKEISLEDQALNMCHPNFQPIGTPKCQKLNKINKLLSSNSIKIIKIKRTIIAVRYLLNIVTMKIFWSDLNLLMILKRTKTLKIQIERKPNLTLPYKCPIKPVLQINSLIIKSQVTQTLTIIQVNIMKVSSTVAPNQITMKTISTTNNFSLAGKVPKVPLTGLSRLSLRSSTS
jgi:hypothetical protein